MGEIHGQAKLLCSPATGELLGGHITRPDANELNHQLIAIMNFRGALHDLPAVPHYHPTLSKILTYSAEGLAQKIK